MSDGVLKSDQNWIMVTPPPAEAGCAPRAGRVGSMMKVSVGLRVRHFASPSSILLCGARSPADGEVFEKLRACLAGRPRRRRTAAAPVCRTSSRIGSLTQNSRFSEDPLEGAPTGAVIEPSRNALQILAPGGFCARRKRPLGDVRRRAPPSPNPGGGDERPRPRQDAAGPPRPQPPAGLSPRTQSHAVNCRGSLFCLPWRRVYLAQKRQARGRGRVRGFGRWPCSPSSPWAAGGRRFSPRHGRRLSSTRRLDASP